MIYTIDQYADKFFNRNKSDIARYHCTGCKQPSATAQQWERAGDMFAVIEDKHIRFNPKNMVTFDEGVR